MNFPILVFCPTNFLYNQLFLRFISTEINISRTEHKYMNTHPLIEALVTSRVGLWTVSKTKQSCLALC